MTEKNLGIASNTASVYQVGFFYGAKMKFLEKDLENNIYDLLKSRNIKTLYDRGFNYYDEDENDIIFVENQVDLMPYGIADIVVGSANYYPHDKIGGEKRIVVDIFELKIEPIKSKHIDQVLTYKRAIDRFYSMTLKNRSIDDCCHIEINCILIGPSIVGGHYVMNELSLGPGDLFVYTYNSTPIEGLTFEYQDNSWYKDEVDGFYEKIKDLILYDETIEFLKSKEIETDKRGGE